MDASIGRQNWRRNGRRVARDAIAKQDSTTTKRLGQARQQLSGFLLRHGHHYNRPAWTLMHRR
jgi:hypothetical protein